MLTLKVILNARSMMRAQHKMREIEGALSLSRIQLHVIWFGPRLRGGGSARDRRKTGRVIDLMNVAAAQETGKDADDKMSSYGWSLKSSVPINARRGYVGRRVESKYIIAVSRRFPLTICMGCGQPGPCAETCPEFRKRQAINPTAQRTLECSYADCKLAGIARLTTERFPVCTSCGRALSNPEPGNTDMGSPDMRSRMPARMAP